MSLIVAENMKSLEAKLAQFGPAARIIADYTRVRPGLETAWPSESKRNANYRGAGLREVSNIHTTNNFDQFTKYSRLQWRLYEKKV